ncbi:MAG: SRPBCC domain-containing protein [Terriglobales bacterium]|jgi:uncharacterized protein YndB with AHSA1/START domain
MPKAMITPDQDAVVCDIEIAAPVERVFEALIQTDQLMQWFNNSECPVKYWKMDARRGGRYSYATVPGSVVVNGKKEFECSGEIIEYDPPRLLVYTWLGNWHVDPSRETVVRWELSPTASGTRVKVTHSGLAEEPASRKDYSGGWVGVMENLKKFTEQQFAAHRKD